MLILSIPWFCCGGCLSLLWFVVCCCVGVICACVLLCCSYPVSLRIAFLCELVCTAVCVFRCCIYLISTLLLQHTTAEATEHNTHTYNALNITKTNKCKHTKYHTTQSKHRDMETNNRQLHNDKHHIGKRNDTGGKSNTGN